MFVVDTARLPERLNTMQTIGDQWTHLGQSRVPYWDEWKRKLALTDDPTFKYWLDNKNTGELFSSRMGQTFTITGSDRDFTWALNGYPWKGKNLHFDKKSLGSRKQTLINACIFQFNRSKKKKKRNCIFSNIYWGTFVSSVWKSWWLVHHSFPLQSRPKNTHEYKGN